MMKAQVQSAPGEWEYKDVPIPIPGNGQLLLKVRVCALGTDETSIGHGFLGVVEEMGADVAGFLIGDRVAACVYPENCFAQYVCVQASECCRLSEEMDDYTAAFAAPLAFALAQTGGFVERLATSCVIDGAHMLQTALARARGFAPIIAVVRGKSRCDAALKMGADYVVDASKCEDVGARVAEILEGKAPDARISNETDDMPAAAQAKPWQEALVLLNLRRVDPKPLFSVAVPLSELPDAVLELRNEDGPVNVFMDTSLQSRFVFPGYSEPMSATLRP